MPMGEARLAVSISVEELRSMIREDTEAVVRAELKSILFRSPQETQSLLPSFLQRTKTERSRRSDGPRPSRTPSLKWNNLGGRRTSVKGNEYGLLDNPQKTTMADQCRTIWPAMPDFCQKVLESVQSCTELREERRKGWLANFVQGGVFQTFFACVIVANAAVMVHLANKDMDEGLSVTHASAESVKEHSSFAQKADIFFLSLYLIELCCKLAVHRLFYFWNDDMKWNWLDFVLILQSLVEIALIPLFSSSGGGRGRGATWIRTFRLFRVAKVLRILRVIKFFTQLHLIITCIVGSIMSLFWSVTVFALLFLLFSLYFVTSTATYIQEAGDSADKEGIGQYFGSVQGCMLTLFMTLTGGEDWTQFYGVLAPMGVSAFFFVCFVAFSHIALLNVVTGIFVESALKIAEPDVHTKAEEEILQKREFAEGLIALLMTADKDNDQYLDKKEFHALMKAGTLPSYLSFLGIDPAWIEANIERLFQQLSEEQIEAGNGELASEPQVTLARFVETCMQLRGNARSTDIRDLHDKVSLISKTIEDHFEVLAELQRFREADSSQGTSGLMTQGLLQDRRSYSHSGCG